MVKPSVKRHSLFRPFLTCEGLATLPWKRSWRKHLTECCFLKLSLGASLVVLGAPQVALTVKGCAYQRRRRKRRRFHPWVRKIPWRRQPTPGFLPGESPEQTSLAGYCPWGHKESDTTEQLSTVVVLNTHTHTHTHTECVCDTSLYNYKIVWFKLLSHFIDHFITRRNSIDFGFKSLFWCL